MNSFACDELSRNAVFYFHWNQMSNSGPNATIMSHSMVISNLNGIVPDFVLLNWCVFVRRWPKWRVDGISSWKRTVEAFTSMNMFAKTPWVHVIRNYGWTNCGQFGLLENLKLLYAGSSASGNSVNLEFKMIW